MDPSQTPSEGTTDEAPEPVSAIDMDTSGLDREASQAALSKVREEAAKHRVEARDAKARTAELEDRYQVFESYDEQDRSTWVNLASDWRDDPSVAATNFRTIANNVLGDPNATPEQVEAAEEILEQTPGSDAVTPETVQALMDERLTARDQKQQQDQAVAAVHQKIGDAGFPQGTVDNFSILWIANNDDEAAGDVDKAIEIYKAKQQGQITTYQENLRANGGTPTIPTHGGTEANAAPPEIKSMEDANNAAKAFLAGRQRG
jgi:MoxR-like ATPase